MKTPTKSKGNEMLRLSDVTTKTEIVACRAFASLGETGPTMWTLGEAFTRLKEECANRIAPRDADEFASFLDKYSYSALDRIEAGETLTVGQIVALWYRARIAEVEAAWLADDDMTYHTYRVTLAGARRQVTSKY